MNRQSWPCVVVLALMGCGDGIRTVEPTGGPLTPGSDEFAAKHIAENGKGYISRPCGFDMDRDGILGEAADRLVGNGETADPDGDGVNEDILYVDSRSGCDESGDGSPIKPYKTIQKALDSADGPGDGAEDIICISGTFHEAITLTQSGVAGNYVRDGFEFPSNPAMLIGWDKDGDGEYPPYDQDDTAVLDGRNELKVAINNRPHGTSYLEVAHLTIRDYGATHKEGNCGAILLRGVCPEPIQSHLYVHDVIFRRINKQATLRSRAIVANFFPDGDGRPYLEHVAFVNNFIDEYRSFCFRGSNRIRGPLRFQNNTIKLFGPGSGTGWKLWGQIDGLEILDNVVDGNPRAWGAKAYTSGAVIGSCTRNATVRGNVFLDLWTAIIIKGEGYPPYPGCKERTVDDVVVDRNIIRNTYNGWVYPPQAIKLYGGFRTANMTAASSLEDVTITNNFISSTMGWNVGIEVRNGNYVGPQVGTITIAGNTIVGPFGKYGNAFAMHAISIYPQYPYRSQSFVIKNNIITRTGGVKRNLGINYVPKSWIAEGNIYDPGTGFIWNNEIVDLARWQKLTGQDANSVWHEPAFVDMTGGDLHLAAGETSGLKVGVDISDITRVDFDGQPG